MLILGRFCTFSGDAVARDRVDRVLTKSRSTATASTASPFKTRSTATSTAVAVAVAVADFYYPTLAPSDVSR